jgi:hypothetical protein
LLAGSSGTLSFVLDSNTHRITVVTHLNSLLYCIGFAKVIKETIVRNRVLSSLIHLLCLRRHGPFRNNDLVFYGLLDMKTS